MKTILKILGVLILLVLALAILLPIIFKGKITELAQEEINKNVNAKVDIGSVNLSLFKSFPNFNLGINDILVGGVAEFEGIKLADIKSLDVSIDLFSVIKGSEYEIKKIAIGSPDIHVIVLENGQTNYDIAAETDESTEPEPATTEGGEFKLTLKKVIITNGNIIYDDQSLNMKVEVTGLEHSLSGDFTADNTNLKTKTVIESLNLNYEGINYLNNIKTEYDATIQADLKNEIYTLKKNSLLLNKLQIVFDGSVSMINEDINLVLTFNSPKTDFKEILSLVPAIYAKDFELIETSGKMSLEGHIKGLYNETTLPAFDINLAVENAMFKYPDLPKSVDKIEILTKISNKGGDADNTVINVSRFHLEMGANPFDAQLIVKTPVSDPDLKGRFKGNIDLASVKDFYPLEEGEDLSGSFLTDITLQGKLSALENEDYDSFTAIGSMLVKGFEYKSSFTNDPVVISNAQLNFSPQYLDLVTLNMLIGKNDLTANGKIENYLSYALKNDILKGNFTTKSNFFDLNTLIPESEASEPGTIETDSTEMEIIEIPGNINFQMASNFNKLIYDSLEMENVGGKISIRDNKLILDNLSMNILEGEMVVNGEYNTVNPEVPEVNFNLNIKEVDIQGAYNTFGIISEYAPIAKKTSGKFSTKVNLQSQLDNQMNPIYETMIGAGELKSTQVTIKNVNTLNKIGDVLNFEELKRMVIDKILFQFEFLDGKVLVEPFDLKHKDFNAQIGGWTGIDKTIDYVMNMNIPREKLGGDANAFLNDLVTKANSKGTNFSLGETISLDVLIGGTLNDPTIKTDLKESGKNLIEDVKKQVQKEIEKKKEEISKEARQKAQKIIDDADAQAKKLVAEAKKQAENIRKGGKDAATSIINEADKQAKNVEAEGKKNGFLAEAAAKETAKQMRKEAQKQADKVEDEADKQANSVFKKANDQAALLKQNAQKEADKILRSN